MKHKIFSFLGLTLIAIAILFLPMTFLGQDATAAEKVSFESDEIFGFSDITLEKSWLDEPIFMRSMQLVVIAENGAVIQIQKEPIMSGLTVLTALNVSGKFIQERAPDYAEELDSYTENYVNRITFWAQTDELTAVTVNIRKNQFRKMNDAVVSRLSFSEAPT